MKQLDSLSTKFWDNKKESLSTNNNLVHNYLNDIGRIPLLSPEEEIKLGEQIQAKMNLLAIKQELAIQLKREPNLQEWALESQLAETLLLQKLKQGQQAKQKMIQANLRLVVSIAKQYQKGNIEFIDLIQEGTLGLIRGVEKFDPTLGYKFSTYAFWWIRQAITRAVYQQSLVVRLPVHINERLNQIKRVQRELSQKLGRTPTCNEIGEVLDLEPSHIRECLVKARHAISLDMRVGQEEDICLLNILEDEGISPESYTVLNFLREDVQKILSKLPLQQREILTLRFGLTDGKELTLAQVGQHMGISRERVRQLEKKALMFLRRHQEKMSIYIAS